MLWRQSLDGFAVFTGIAGLIGRIKGFILEGLRSALHSAGIL